MTKRALLLVLVLSLVASACFAVPFPQLARFLNRQDGDTIFASDWNKVVGGIWVNFNQSLLTPNGGLNCLSKLGDMYVCNGNRLQPLHNSQDQWSLYVDSTQPTNFNWRSVATVLAPFSIGGLLIFDGSNQHDLFVGSDGQVLQSNLSALGHVTWSTQASPWPSGIIMPISSTTPIPTGWVLCDGSNHTPNLIGMMLMGSSSLHGNEPGAPFGYSPNVAQTQGHTFHKLTHVHSVHTFLSNTPINVPGGTAISHALPENSTASDTTSKTQIVPCMASLVYIMKQ